jgi:hypothetical protein
MFPERSEEFTEMLVQFAKQVRAMPYEASSITIFSELPNDDKIEAFIGGVMIGMMTALREQVRTKDTMDSIEKYVASCVPLSRRMAEQYEETKSTGS